MYDVADLLHLFKSLAVLIYTDKFTFNWYLAMYDSKRKIRSKLLDDQLQHAFTSII